MKAERRHELQQNTLARWIENLPIAARLYADKILLVVALVLLAIVVYRWRNNAAVQRETLSGENLAIARTSISRLGMLNPAVPDLAATYRTQFINDATNAIETIARDSSQSDLSLRSEAMLARGDLYWTMANLPELPGAATQPSLQIVKQSKPELLKQAEEAYTNVLNLYPTEKNAIVAARFGLAAIAENRRDWDVAAKTYSGIRDSDAIQMYKDLAADRLKRLDEYKEPLLVGTLTTKPAEIGPLNFSGNTNPTTAPATMPTAVPTTQPGN